MRKLRFALVAALIFALVLILSEARYLDSTAAASSGPAAENAEATAILSPIWGAAIRQWSTEIQSEALNHGLDPDFIAAVIDAESNGNQFAVSRVGAVGLMGIMPAGPGLEWRPEPESLVDPTINLSWGVAILTEIMRQSGGDIGAALAAYSGGWDQANSRVPRRYAASVLDAYGRAVAARSDVSPDIASEWTIAAEIRRGHIPVEPLIFDEQPVSGLRKYGEHVVYHSADRNGRAYYVKGFAVPLALVVPLDSDTAPLQSDSLDSRLMVRLGMSETKLSGSNPRVILACLPSLARLRGQLATRWFAPSACPAWHRLGASP